MISESPPSPSLTTPHNSSNAFQLQAQPAESRFEPLTCRSESQEPTTRPQRHTTVAMLSN
ncbi:hypothetical protein ElyMa_006123500 [Elysia marginata]|uniref:Uncharacterized protein n=1 Tax=Elysia marginata TaxID=1093978 RepID=A0AAV4GY16_9GAST|nr:hypothetical protein ElyMa_006123500 [Elysia marginata]